MVQDYRERMTNERASYVEHMERVQREYDEAELRKRHPPKNVLSAYLPYLNPEIVKLFTTDQLVELVKTEFIKDKKG